MKPADITETIDGDSLQFYPPIAQLAVVGDRRTAAVIGADGMVRWLCLPDYDGIPVFGCLLDSTRGGHWRLGPATGGVGRQSYIDSNNVLVTCWQSADAELELTDAMLAPEERRPAVTRDGVHCCAGCGAAAAPLSAQSSWYRVTVSRPAFSPRRCRAVWS